MSVTVVLPDILSSWPARRGINPHYEEVSSECTKWVESFHVLDPKAQEIFNTHIFPLVSAMTYPYMNREHLRLSTDLHSWFFVYDAVSDVRLGASVREIGTGLMAVLKDPTTTLPAPSALNDMTKCLWSRILSFGALSATQRLKESLLKYVAAVSVEASDREIGYVRSIEDFLTLRRDTIAVKCCLDLFLLPYDIPEEVMTHPSIQRLTDKTMDLIIFNNDILSYNFERRHGQDGHNFISAVMKEKSLDVQGALDYTGELCQETMRSLLEDIKAVPSFSPSIDEIIQEYIVGLNTLMTGLYEWSFETVRYFGAERLEVKRTRVLQLYVRPSGQIPSSPDGNEGNIAAMVSSRGVEITV